MFISTHMYWQFNMDTGRVFMFILLLLFPVLGQISDNKLDDVLFVGDQNLGAICRMNINLNDSCVYIELPGYVYPTDIDYDPVEDTLYWTNQNNDLMSAKLLGNSNNIVTTLIDYGQIYGIAVDSVSRLLFYTSSSYMSSVDGFIAVVVLDDSLQKTIISRLVNPRGIALDRINGTIYWAAVGSPAKIEKSNYDGTNRQELVNSGLVYPYGIDVDVNAGILYWCDTRTIERVNVDGSNRSIIYRSSDVGYGCIIALYQSYLYFTDQYGYQLMIIGTDGGGLVSVASDERIYAVAIHVNTHDILGINGCSNMNGGCSHFCLPSPGGNKICACPNLMTLQPDGQSCRQDTLPEVLLISYNGFVSGEDIRENYTHFFIPLPHRVSAYDIDYDRKTDDIYWVQADNKIYSSKIFGKNDTTSRSMNNYAQIYGIATDTISRLMFYTDWGNHVIAVISLQDFSQKTIISSGLVNPTDIIADPINGIIYWVDMGTPAKIEKSNYDGSNRQEVVGSDLRYPFDLDVDFEAGLLYWCDINNFRIERSNLDGSNRSTIYQEQVSFSRCSLVFYQSFIFFTRWWSSYDIMRIETDGSGLTTIALLVHQYPIAIHVTINGSLGNNGCSNGSDACSHLCFPMPDGNHVCDCPNFMSLMPDRKTCQLDNLPDTFLLITLEYNRYIYRMDITNYSYVTIPTQNGYNSPYAIDYDPSTALMFWTVRYSPQIVSGPIYGNNQTTLLYGERYGEINGIAVDLISKLMFYTDYNNNFIGVICLKKRLHKLIIVEDIYKPQAIVTDSNTSSIYWSSFNKIEKSNYDGTSRQIIVDTGMNNSVDLALDINERVIFWCHYNTRKIEVANVNGSNRQVLYEDPTSISKCCIALYESHLYYIDTGLHVLMRIGTNGSGMTFIGNSLTYGVSDLYMHSISTKKPGVNRCSINNGGCSHFCLPRPGGSKVCDCPDNMTLQQDGLTCGNYSLPENFILLIDLNYVDIYIMEIPSYRYITFGYENLFLPAAVAYDPVNLEFYWTDQRFRRIMVSSANGKVKRTVKRLSRSVNLVGIALDVQSRLLFYVDSNNGTLAALSLDGYMHKTIIKGSFPSPSYIAIDSINGTIYWISQEMSYKIEKSNYDGTNRQELISFGSVGQPSLAIDIRAGFIYWTNYKAIERCNVDGTNRQVIYQDQTAYFYGIALYQSNIYIAGYSQQRYTLMKIRRDGSNPVLFGPRFYNVYIAVHSNDYADPNSCSNKNSGCSHFCFPSTAGLYVCACPDGQILRRDDNHTCRSYMDVCDDHPCNNSGICTNFNGTYLCNCSRGWQGENCSTDIDECLQDPCQNGGVCNNTYGSFFCTCSRGWQGQNCTVGIKFEFGVHTNDTVLNAKDDACGEPIYIVPVPIYGEKYDKLYVCTNGLLSFQREFTNPNPSADDEAYSGHSFLAPYYTDFDTSGDNNSGKVYYHLYDVLRDKYLQNNSNVLKAQNLLKEVDEVQSFQATMIFISTWYKNSPYPIATRSNESASFQMVLSTDGYNTFVFYIYFSGEMKLRMNNVFIGYRFNTSRKFKRHLFSFTSQTENIDMHVDRNGLNGLIVYRLTPLDSSVSNFDVQCLEWFSANQANQDEYNRIQAEMPKCPCNSRWIVFDPWFRIPQPIFLDDVNTSCIAMAPSLRYSPHGKVCCFDDNTGAFLSNPPVAGGFLKYHPVIRTKEFESEDLRMRKICCKQSNYCHLYYTLRPVGECYTEFPYDFALTWGDPHIKTLDSKTYTFNGWGEFTLINLETENISFILQGRTDKARSLNGTLSDATIFTAFAARDNNNASIQVEMSTERNGTYVYGNGVDYSVALANIEKNFTVTTETLTIQRASHTRTLNILFSSTGQPISLNVTVSAEMLSLAVTLPPDFKNKTKGLLGNYDGNPNNDFKYPNGTVLNGNSTERTLFNYGISWAINDSNSVFMYPNGKSHADFDHRNFTPKFFDEATNEQISAASLLCGSNTECKYDFIMTSSELVAENTKFVQAEAENGTREVSNQIPILRVQNMAKVSADRQISLNITAIDDGPVTFQFDINTVGAEFVYKDSTRAELNFTLDLDNQCELSITAKDNHGYFAPPIRYEYTYCDGCSSHGKCDLNTDQSETCSVKRLKCICEPYWEGTSCQKDLDGCRGSPCSLNRSCTDVNATYHKISGIAFRCSKCPQGYLEDGNKCLDIDECNKTTNECDQRCINTEGSFICECKEGFALSTDKRTCEDIDECERDLDNCNQSCTNNIGNFTCSCFPGFAFNTSLAACVLTAVPDKCNPPAINCTLTAGCTVRNGTASCFCGKGFQLSKDGTRCSDIDECSSNPCTHICNNSDGGFTCRCYQGYELGNDRRTCSECRYPKYGNYCQETCDCGTHGVQCHHVKGCQCDLGWEGEKCQHDIDECTKTPNICGDPYSECKNIPGHYTCQCVAGFEKSNTGDCQDIDECSNSRLNKCSQSCTNTLGNFTCGCNKGYQLDQKDSYTCFDVDECSIGNAGCEQICENVPGQYNCYCHYGYKLATNRRTCVNETDVCGRIASNISCSQICLVQNGKAICACQQGYVLDMDNKTCKDVNECEWNKTCSQKDKCINLIGSFLCSCDDGFRLDNDGVTCRECDAFHFGKDCNRTCNCGVGAVRCDKVSGCTCKPGWKDSTCNIDIDECVLNKSLCPGANTKCINTPGSYLCTCQNGYKRKSNTSVDCTDINECDDPVLNTCDQNCTNNNGSYSCACNKGFIWQDTRCVDINECEPRNPCHHVCYNLQGGYRCLCYTGFKTDVDNATQCKPITECPQNETDFCKRKGAQCAIVKGNAACKCGNGLEWSNENETCIDLKDCTPSARCNQICIENIGGYTCTCSKGYRLLQDNMTCVPCVNNTYSNGCTETCQCVPNNAVNETQTCNHINGTCNCKTGWEGKCDRDIDECTRTPQICRGIRNSGCHNTIGGYECSCFRGYVRQNNQCIPDTFPTTTLLPQVDETFAAMSVKLDIPLLTGVNLNVTATYEYYSYEANVALVQFYRRWLNDKLKRITIRSLTSGSLNVDYIIYIFDDANVGVDLTLANVDLASGASIIFQNNSVKVLDLKVAGRLVPTNLSDEELCTFFQLSYRTCNSGYNCKVTNKVPTCSKIAPDDYYLTTILAVSIPLALLLIGVIVVGICVFKRRASNGRRAGGNTSRTFSDRTMTTERDVNKQNTSSTVKTNVPTGTSSTGDKDDRSTVSSWHSSAAELCQNEEFRIKRPKLDSCPIRI